MNDLTLMTNCPEGGCKVNLIGCRGNSAIDHKFVFSEFDGLSERVRLIHIL